MADPIWPLDRPAAEVVKLPMTGPTPAWAVFDADWYRARHEADVAGLPDRTDKTLHAYYLSTGQTLAHSPNPWFDEAWYRAAHPTVARLLASGDYASGMDHYCQGGHSLDLRPHWLFDERYYRLRYTDLTDQVLNERRLANGYDHFLRNGNREGRIGHALFDPARFLANFDPETAAIYRQTGGYRVFLTRFADADPEPRTSHYFDPAWYRARYPEVVQAISDGRYRSALEHYLRNDTPERYDPLPQFSEAWYRLRNQDVAAAIAARQIRNGYAHFLGSGLLERRAPAAGIDLRWYSQLEAVMADLHQRRAPDAFTHLLVFGLAAGLPTAPPDQPGQAGSDATETATGRLAASLLPALGRIGLDFTCAGTPEITVALAPHNDFPALMTTLAAVRDACSAIDLVIVDRGSTDATRTIARHVRGAQIVRFETRIEEQAARNAALQCARADMILFLSPDTRPAHGAVARSLHHLRHDPAIGAVCGMTVTEAGLISDAGGIAWDDGELEYHAAGASPLAPEANIQRDADFAPPHFLLARVELLVAMGSVAKATSSLDHAVALLSLAMRAQGSRVLYDPAVIAHRGRAAELTNTDVSRTLVRERGSDLLSRRAASRMSGGIAPRPVHEAAHRILYIDDAIPLRITGSGFVRSNDVIWTMARMGYAVTVFPILGCRHDLASVYADMPATAELLHDRSLADLPEFLRARQGWFDTIWVSRIHNLDMVVPILADIAPPAPRLILDTEAITSERRHARLALIGQGLDLSAAIAEELRNAHGCNHIMAVSDRDAATLRIAGFSAVSVLGHVRVPTPTPRPFARRAGMLFVGAIHEQDSPNHDSLCWFTDAVLPLIEQALGWETRLTIAGYTAPEVSMDRFMDHPRITLRGAMPDLTPLYDTHRLFVAPTRFAAGMPYKIQEAASFGLPVVATSLLAEQLGWQDGVDLASVPTGDAETMARCIVELYRDEIRWTRLRDGALRRIRMEHAPDAYLPPLRDALGPASLSRG